MYIKNFLHQEPEITEFSANSGESWCIFGSNDSGVEVFLHLLQGNLEEYSTEKIEFPDSPGVITFENQQKIFEEELRNDDSDFLNRFDPGTPVRDFLTAPSDHVKLRKSQRMCDCLDLGYRTLSPDLPHQ